MNSNAVINTLPNDQAGIEDGLEVKPGVIEEAEIRVANGVWKFQGWDSDRKVICGSDLEFVGTWVFEEDVIPTQEAEPISESQTDPLPTSNSQTDTVTETDAPKESDPSLSPESKETETSIVEPIPDSGHNVQLDVFCKKMGARWFAYLYLHPPCTHPLILRGKRRIV